MAKTGLNSFLVLRHAPSSPEIYAERFACSLVGTLLALATVLLLAAIIYCNDANAISTLEKVATLFVVASFLCWSGYFYFTFFQQKKEK